MSSNGYQQSTAQVMMTLCTFAYAQEGTNSYETISQAISNYLSNSGTQFATGQDWELSWLGLTKDGENLMYLAQNTTQANTFAFAIRGTDFHDLDDIVQDAYVFETTAFPYTYPSVNSNIVIANGTLEGLNDLLDTFGNAQGIIQPASAKISDFLKSEGFTAKLDAQQPLTLYVTGHSLGGALATAFTSWLVDFFNTLNGPGFPYSINLQTYTFASPSVGNQDYADYYNAQPANTNITFADYDVYNIGDIVPYCCADLGGIPGNGWPWGLGGLAEAAAAIAAINKVLSSYNVPPYVRVGMPFMLDALNSYPPNWPHNQKIETPSDIGEWTAFNHVCNTYLGLLGAPLVPDTSSPSISLTPPSTPS